MTFFKKGHAKISDPHRKDVHNGKHYRDDQRVVTHEGEGEVGNASIQPDGKSDRDCVGVAFFYQGELNLFAKAFAKVSQSDRD